jgi:hypothetical protein
MLFLSPQIGWKQWVIILVIGLAFIWMPQQMPNDWELNTKYFWSNIPKTYIQHPDIVYPPWGLILLLPYYLIHAVGARVLSVFTMGWFIYKRRLPLADFFFLVLSPYFLWTMLKSNVDILVIVLPVLLWEYSEEKHWKNILRGISFALLLIKPQCNLLIQLYLLWQSRTEWKEEVKQLVITGILIIPICFIGSPPLILQWLKNISSPSAQNQLYWAINNMSLTTKYGFLTAFGIIFLSGAIFIFLVKRNLISWKNDQTLFFLLLCSMQISPYTSQQSYSGALTFIPSWAGFAIQWVGVFCGFAAAGINNMIPLWTFAVSVFSLFSYSLFRPRITETDQGFTEISFLKH